MIENPPIFPTSEYAEVKDLLTKVVPGATLHDLFAAAALCGLLMRHDQDIDVSHTAWQYAAMMMLTRPKDSKR